MVAMFSQGNQPHSDQRYCATAWAPLWMRMSQDELASPHNAWLTLWYTLCFRNHSLYTILNPRVHFRFFLSHKREKEDLISGWPQQTFFLSFPAFHTRTWVFKIYRLYLCNEGKDLGAWKCHYHREALVSVKTVTVFTVRVEFCKWFRMSVWELNHIGGDDVQCTPYIEYTLVALSWTGHPAEFKINLEQVCLLFFF